MFGPTRSPAHLINIYKKALFLLSANTEARVGLGTGAGGSMVKKNRHTIQNFHLLQEMEVNQLVA